MLCMISQLGSKHIVQRCLFGMVSNRKTLKFDMESKQHEVTLMGSCNKDILREGIKGNQAQRDPKPNKLEACGMRPK